jgi:ABC-type Fe3+-hydroxamate transport system substrate-binding protein
VTADAGRIVVRDDLGDELVFDDLPGRIVSLVPSITETVIDLGAAERLVGITNYCVHPAEVVAGLAKVGGTKGFSLQEIDTLQPDLILANKEENRKHQIDALRKDYPVFVTYPRTVDQAIEMALNLGVLTGTSTRATEFAVSCNDLLRSLDRSVVGQSLRTACMIWRDPWMAAGPDSYMSDLLGTLGLVSVFTGAEGRYPETSLDAILRKQPDVIILPDEPYEFGAEDKTEIEAFLQKHRGRARVLRMDGSYLTWFGTRTLKGLRFLYDAKVSLVQNPS